MGNVSDWKTEKELLVSNLTGSSYFVAQSYLLSCPVAVLMNALAVPRREGIEVNLRLGPATIDFLCCLFPVMQYLLLPWPWLSVVVIVTCVWRISVKERTDPVSIHNGVHVGRGMLVFVTCLTILAVDFPAFPRYLAKTESYGFSLMDAGVGAFVFTNGMFSPWARRTSDAKAREKRTVSVSTLVLTLVGVLRVIAVKFTGYQEHVSEYGVHGNFFFILAAVRCISSHTDHVMARGGWLPSAVATCLMIIHEGILRCGVESYVMSAPSDRSGLNLLSQNREMFASFLGYLALYYVGVDYGLNRLQDTPLFFCNVRSPPMFVTGCVFLLVLNQLFGLFPPSRRIVNLGYVAWTGFATWLHYETCVFIQRVHAEQRSQLLKPFVEDAVGSKFGERLELKHVGEPSSEFLRDVSRESLAVFLLANLLTGLVNLSINTTQCGKYGALIILGVYACVLRLAVAKLPTVRRLCGALRKHPSTEQNRPPGGGWGSVY